MKPTDFDARDWGDERADDQNPRGDVQRLRRLMRQRMALQLQARPTPKPCTRCQTPTLRDDLCAMCVRDDELAIGRANR